MHSVLRARPSVLRSLGVRSGSALSWSDNKNVVNSPLTSVDIKSQTVPERVFEFASRWPEKIAVICGETSRSYTYAALERRTRALAAALRSRLSLRESECVAVLLPNCPEYVVATLSAMMNGAKVALINPAYKSFEMKHQFSLVKPKLIIAASECYPVIRETLNEMKTSVPVMIIDNGTNPIPDGAIRYSEFSDVENIDLDCLKSVRVSPQDTAILPFSSGTTGLPKAVDLPHRALVATSYICTHPDLIMPIPATCDHQDTIHAILPFYHIYGFVGQLLNNLVHGCKLVTLARFTPELFLKILAEHRANIDFVVPPIIQFLTQHPLVKTDYLDAMRLVICGGASLPEVDVQAFENKAKKTELVQGYGLTESTSMATATPKGTRHLRRLDTCGIVLPNISVKVTAVDTGDTLGPNQEGELWIHGPTVMTGYYNNPEQTKATLMEDGWLRTGDFGYYDDKRHFYVTERLKELIKVKGFQVAPAELEGVLLTHPAVLDAGVTGVPKPNSSEEEPVAFVVLRPGASARVEELTKHVADRVAGYKRLGSVRIVDTIPKTNTGKILRRELRSLYL